MENQQEQDRFEGWAVIEMMGHRKEVGFVTTKYFGGAALFKVETPEIPEKEFALDRAQYIHSPPTPWTHAGSVYAPKGTLVKRSAIPARIVFVAPNSLYAMTPVTEEMATVAIVEALNPTLTPVNPQSLMIESRVDSNQMDDEDQD